jgi:hypothetical protein
MTVAYAKSVLRRLALAGYNMAMLYTEDTYGLPASRISVICVERIRLRRFASWIIMPLRSESS